MIRQFFHTLLLRRHFWRYATFSEVAELYASSMLRKLAINISAAFVSVFLYQTGYSIVFIATYWAMYYFVKIFMSFPAAQYASKFGPKHGILLSNLLYIPAMILFVYVPTFGIPALIATSLLQGASATLYNICYYINFSKVKSVEHAGKELAYMNIIEKIATGLSPLIGGFLAFVAGPQTTMWAAAILFALASIPLLRTGEPPRSRQRFVFRGFPWRMVYRSLIAETGVGFDVLASGTVWSLLVSVAILGTGSNDVYAKLGALLSVVLLAAIASSYVFGRLIDRRRGGELMFVSVIGDALVHLSRPFVNSIGVVLGTNITNEVATTGYTLAFVRGMFDTADLSGHRITYVACIEVMGNVGAALAGVAFVICVMLFGDIQGMKNFFFVAAAAVLIIGTAKFHLYRR